MMKKLRAAPKNLPPTLRDVVEYRKSGLSLNHVVGCPLDCSYCVRHLFANYDMKRPHLVMDDEAAVATLVDHWAFRPNVTPIQIFNRATDPFLPVVKEHLFSTLEELDRRQFTNQVLVITRWKIDPADVVRLERLAHIRLTILVTWSGISDKRIEPIDSGIAEASLMTLSQNVRRTKVIFYWRPLIAGLNDSDAHLSRARELGGLAHATVFTGLFFREEIRRHFRTIGVEDLYNEIARRKIFPEAVERRVLDAFEGQTLFRKTSCGVGFAHGVADFNGHYGIREICNICPLKQVKLCAAAHRQPSQEAVEALAGLAGLEGEAIEIDERRITVSNSAEQQRYFIQHALNYQVHDRALPHLEHRHGRAEVGWS
ncbi:radical SAM protein [Rhizobium leguminosarum bv. viciae]|uniref:radical SAM protein n=1 Tax=Rhizobium leguminosarum TaxID=384 RepID=UPI00144239D6|nr:radical SAM protein [Rhizobium leguminosarum]NKK87525.1 radical SAM protein [Rhizobium leguminosarum bv. viciae]